MADQLVLADLVEVQVDLADMLVAQAEVEMDLVVAVADLVARADQMVVQETLVVVATVPEA